jgi:4-hydroxy-tetrahydrodipicolinate synthase
MCRTYRENREKTMMNQNPDLLTPASGDFNGVFTPLLVPWDENGQVNETELRRFVPWLIDNGVRGVYANGSIGEFPRLNSAERRRVVKVVCEAAVGRAPVLAGAGEANVAETLDACAAYAEYGARAVAVVSPFYYRLDASSVYAYYAELAARTPIDLLLYNIPAFASPIDVSTFRKLAEFPRIIGIKDSTGDVGAMIKMITAVRGKPYLRPCWRLDAMAVWSAAAMPYRRYCARFSTPFARAISTGPCEPNTNSIPCFMPCWTVCRFPKEFARRRNAGDFNLAGAGSR